MTALVVATLAVLSTALAAPVDNTNSRLNVLFLAADDLRMQIGHNDVDGTPKMATPNFDALIKKSLWLSKAQVQQAVCSPTRTSLLTSRYPDTTRVWDLYSYFRDEGGNFTTIPQYFKEQGYLTKGMGKIFHPGHASGKVKGDKTLPGDDVPHSWSHDKNMPYYHAPNLQYWSSKKRIRGCDGCGNSWIAVTPEAEKKMPLPDTQTAQHAVQTLKRFSQKGRGRSGADPFFLAVGFHKPHLPFVAPERFFHSYPLADVALPKDQQPPQAMPQVAWSGWGELRAYHDIAALNNTGQPGDLLPAAVTKALRRAYFASVSYTDYNLGLVLQALEDEGYSNNTVISFWGDHGWQLGEHGEWCKHTNFNLATNAPLLIHIPGQTDAGIASAVPTEFIDLMPTLAEAAAKKTIPACPPGNTSHIRLCTHGVSLLPLVAAPQTPVKPAAYSQYPRGYQKPSEATGQLSAEQLGDLRLGKTPSASACLTKKCTMGYSLLTRHEGREYRYTEWVDFNTKTFGKPDWDRSVGTELYDHEADPNENQNVAASASASLLTALGGLLRAHPVFGAGPSH